MQPGSCLRVTAPVLDHTNVRHFVNQKLSEILTPFRLSLEFGYSQYFQCLGPEKGQFVALSIGKCRKSLHFFRFSTPSGCFQHIEGPGPA